MHKDSYEIFLVEDNLAQIGLFEEAIKEGRENVTLRTASSGESALSLLRNSSQKPDLIFLDLHLPTIKGKDVLHQIKSDPQLKNIPVIIFTTSSRERDIEEAYAHHANCYIQKPLHFDQFVKIIKSVENFWLRPSSNIPVMA